MSQTITEWKLEGQEKLARYKQLLNKNELTDAEWKEADYIKNKFGDHPMFKQARDDNYDARATHSGFGAPNCYCHIAPPCENCIAWTNTCAERDGEDTGCMQVLHDCEMADEYGYEVERLVDDTPRSSEHSASQRTSPTATPVNLNQESE